jgi:hypothetical protein
LEDLGQAIQHVAWMLGIDRLLRLDRWGFLKKLDDFLLRITRLPPMNSVSYLKEFDGLLSVITKPPRFDRWGYWEKFDYWGPYSGEFTSWESQV